MGVYSNQAAEKLKSDAIYESFSSNSLLEFAINTERSEQAMFDSLLEMDFTEAYNEHGIVSIDEAEVKEGNKVSIKKIVDFIKKKLHELAVFLDTQMKKFAIKFAEVFKMNDKLLATVGDDVEITDTVKEKLKEVKFKTVKGDSEKIINAALDVVKDKFNQVNDTDPNTMKIDLNNATDKFDKDYKEFFQESDALAFLVGGGAKKIAEKLRRGFKGQVDKLQSGTVEIKRLVDKAMSELKDPGDNVSEADRSKYAKLAANYTALSATCSKIIGFAYNITVQEMFADRGTYAKIAAAVKASKSADTKSQKAAQKAYGKPSKDKDGNEVGAAVATVDNSVQGKNEATDLTLEMFIIDIANEDYMNKLFG